MSAATPRDDLVHASCVAVEGRAVVITGSPGSGKSSLALDLMAHGAVLVSDDQTVLTQRDGHLWASAPDALLGLIEARGTGLLQATTTRAPVVLVVDLDQSEPDRLPPTRKCALAGHEFDLILGRTNPNLASHVLQYLRGGRRA